MDRRIGFLTIGQAPRRDIVPAILAALPGASAVEAGALDGLGPEEVASLAPRDDDLALITIVDGREVVVGKRAVSPRLQALMERLENNVDLFVVLCTGGFPPFATTRPVLLPDRMLKGAVAALWSEGPLGVIAPLSEQIDMNRALWAGYPLKVEVASPYESPDALDAAAANLRDRGARLVVMNCMGFTEAMKARVRGATGVPALLPSSVAAHFIGECL